MAKGLIIGGEFGDILVRQKNDSSLELGELLIAENEKGKIILQVFDLLYGSQLSQSSLELASGLKLEENESLELLDPKLRNYVLARLKTLAFTNNNVASSAKTLPTFFTNVRDIDRDDVSFLVTPNFALTLGKLRSGSKVLDVPVCIDGKKALSHHVLVTGTTGRGKSVFMTNILSEIIGCNYASMLVLDPHNEYFERLRNHAKNSELIYYSPNTIHGARTLRVNLSQLIPKHFDGAFDWSDAQRQALNAYFHAYKDSWIEAVLKEKELKQQYHEGTLAVVKRTLMQLLRLDLDENKSLIANGIFDTTAGKTTILDICLALEDGKTVIIDTSAFQGSVEVLIGSLLASAILDRQKSAENTAKPVISVVIEEAPRVLGKEVLEKGPNIFSTIAREGRKFNVGLVAITQLPSLIPREVLANINTKVIFGTELRAERQAIIESASQDLSSDDRLIASLDKGEAIITSNFLSFAMPIKAFFEEKKQFNEKRAFPGVNL